jgi:dihydrodipicolinate synthase/N-acetylneuraminate lyase
MKTTAVTKDDLTRSVIAVPPLCRNADDTFSLNADENRKLIAHLEGGGISTLLYGGNANLYNIAVSEYDQLLGMLSESVAEDTWVIPSVGPMYGTIVDQAAILKGHEFPTAMVLPTLFPATAAGIQTAVRKFVETSGIPAVLYIKDAAYITPDAAAELVDEGIISWVKYAIVREDPARDDYLTQLLERVDPAMVVSGIGEQPTVAHVKQFGLAGFTSGCVCVAPSKSMAVLAALKSGDIDTANTLRDRFFPLENLRNTHGPIPVLHHSVALSGIADTGPHLPLMSSLPDEHLPEIEAAAEELLRWERS